MANLYGYRRENGTVGIRNHVVVIPVDDLSNAACEAVARQVTGTFTIPHPFGFCQAYTD
ncbi:UxaA family hydrolase [Effusibacillus lacus]|uniref:UxaA family hydrolase n=1 Tax=Effusibacillus lacus TaxID=1348429 RepID=UPI000BB8F3BE|nr:UxaA family hydrolase [Effusibacillus lacus]TCS72312.1 D-galactarate dehydratase/altronate hydrolase [Effusibacillus lacus]